MSPQKPITVIKERESNQKLFQMDPTRQSNGSLQTPSNQVDLSDPSKLLQGVREPIQTQSLPMHYTQPLQKSVTSVDIQQPPVQMSQPFSGVWQQAAPCLRGSRLGISSGSSPSIQNPLREGRAPWIHRPRFKIFGDSSCPRKTPLHEMLQLSEKFKDMTTEPLRSTVSGRIHGRKIMCSKYRYRNRLETIPEVGQNTTNESTNLVSGNTQVPLSSGSVQERRIADVRYRYGTFLPKSLLRKVEENDSVVHSRIEGFACFQIPIMQPDSSGLLNLPNGVNEPGAFYLQPINLAQLLQTPATSVGTQRPPRQMSPPLSGAWQQAAPWLLGISTDSSRSRQNTPQEEEHISENPNNMNTDNDTMS